MAFSTGCPDAVVWLQYCTASSCLTTIVAAQATEVFTPYHVTRLTSNASLRCDAPVVETLMIALGRRVGEAWVDRVMER